MAWRRRPALHSKRWLRLRLATFERDGYRCRACGRAGRLECDHVRPVHKGGDPWALANLQTLCRRCHIAKTAADKGESLPADVAEWRAFEAAGDG